MGRIQGNLNQRTTIYDESEKAILSRASGTLEEGAQTSGEV